MRKSNPLQFSIQAAAISGIFFAWVSFTIEACKIGWHVISYSPKKDEISPVYKAVCGYCQKTYDDDEYHMIHGTHLCEACR